MVRACAIAPAAWRCLPRSFSPHPSSATLREGKPKRIFFGHFQIRDRNPLNAQTKADPITSTNAGGTNASTTGS